VSPSDYAQSSSYKNEVLPPSEQRTHITHADKPARMTLVEMSSKPGNKTQAQALHRNVDTRKIQSDNKDIEDDSGNNFVAERRSSHIVPTSLPEQRSTHMKFQLK